MKSKYSLLFSLILLASCQQSKNDSTETKNDVNWKWPDSLDAVVAALASHTVIFEDSIVRILKVTVNPGEREPIHAHQWRSLVWASKSSPFTLYAFDVDKDKLVLKDSFSTKLELNKVNNWNPEEPHSIKNLGKDTLLLYRVEFKSKNTN